MQRLSCSSTSDRGRFPFPAVKRQETCAGRRRINGAAEVTCNHVQGGSGSAGGPGAESRGDRHQHGIGGLIRDRGIPHLQPSPERRHRRRQLSERYHFSDLDRGLATRLGHRAVSFWMNQAHRALQLPREPTCCILPLSGLWHVEIAQSLRGYPLVCVHMKPCQEAEHWSTGAASGISSSRGLFCWGDKGSFRRAGSVAMMEALRRRG